MFTGLVINCFINLYTCEVIFIVIVSIYPVTVTGPAVVLLLQRLRSRTYARGSLDFHMRSLKSILFDNSRVHSLLDLDLE